MKPGISCGMVRSTPAGVLIMALVSCCAGLLAWPARGAVEERARAILEATGTRGGLVVHLGCGDGRLTEALRAGRAFRVHGLDTDAEAVQAARQRLVEQGAYGPVSVDTFDGRHLPYIDNLVNLVVAERLFQVSREELLRVLVPGGTAYVKQGDSWEKIVKPRPAEMDDWTHFLHGPDNNAVSDDTLVDFPFHLQWLGSPAHSRDHELASSTHIVVSAGGRLYCIIDEGPTALPYYLPARWHLIARDAFNGLVLWRRPLAEWQPHLIRGRKSVAADLWRRLVATEQAVYVTETIFGPVVALDPHTGRTLQRYDGTERTEEIVYHDGVLYLVASTAAPDQIDRRALATQRKAGERKRIMAVDARTGRLLWSKEDEQTDAVQPLTLAVSNGRVVFQNTRAVICLDAASGRTLWEFARPSPAVRPGYETPTLVVHDDVVLSADRAAKRRADRSAARWELIALSAETGRELWRAPCAENVGAGADVFVAQGLVWVGETPRRAQSDYNHGRDLHTGEIKKTFSHAENWPTWHHHRCYRDKATQRYILAGRTGIEFIDLQTGRLTPHHWVRGVCEYGILPANGLIYCPPDQCACYIQSKMHGFYALAPRRPHVLQPAPPPEVRLEKGPAYGQVPPAQTPASTEWPTFRHDNRRSGHLPGSLPLELKPAWHTRLGGKLTALTAAGGRLFGAQAQRHRVFCLDAASGRLEWDFVAGGVVDSPPTVAEGLAVFGCHDGWIYALRASDGQLVWRFRAAPHDLRLVDRGQLASLWPVHGSVLVENGAVYAAAGRSSYFDGGMYLYKLDLRTGRPLIQRRYYSRDPETGERIDLFTPYAAEVLPDRELPGLLPDIFSADEQELFLRSVPFSRELAILDRHYVPHLFGSLGFLEDTWWERTYWIYGVHFYSGARGHAYARTLFPGGRLLVFDETSVYGYQDAGLNADAPGIFRVAKEPPWIDLASALASKATGRRAEKKGIGPIDAEEIRRTFVWKKGVPQNPQAMLLTKGRRNVRDAIRRMVKYRYDWQADVPLYPNAMVLSSNALWLAGPPRFDEQAAAQWLALCPTEPARLPPVLREALETFEGKKGGVLVAADTDDGSTLARIPLPTTPVFDGMIASGGKLYVALRDGSVLCLAKEK